MASEEQLDAVPEPDKNKRQLTKPPTPIQFFTNNTSGWQDAYPGEQWPFTNTFTTPFSSPPQIIPTFSAFDVGNNADDHTFRLGVTINDTDISATEVKSTIAGWDDTTVYGASTILMAIPPVSPFQADTVSVPAGGLSGYYVTFKSEFFTQPQVFATFTSLSLSIGYRLEINVSNITKTGFMLDVNTWGSPVLNSATIQWLAWPGGNTQLGAYEVHKFNQLSESVNGHFDFNEKFTTPPNMFMGISKMDIAGSADARLTLTTDATTKRCNWEFKTWGDTVIWELDVHYLAVGDVVFPVGE